MMKRKLRSTIQPHSQIKSMQTETIVSKELFCKKIPRPITNTTIIGIITIIGSVAVLVIPLSALKVLSLSKCGKIHIQLNPFELQLIKEETCMPSDQQIK
ncbi:hypothetical protein VF14_13730 [Nostoc linckia z18]|uniref:Uncharacterized protein n=2 Tax=Nostoc linckia TaxID=92942 RepID=A0A9Q6EL24_NOSLI|nr:hypothetical protein VF02_25865 [Nostoc linckia z1]PHJ61867.1 hypothetical protein VF05_27565 [Nostoc linckia z3]PHJ67784.1 hypothetical protein VF03_25315 [Nostoc linckia z2]PHJ78965.1 hypothetical protein VF06_27240 [Nostoc linckia z4]PHJ83292.1 hypothetical protein VF07_26810 [Nostoc linckia z6]PHJ95593.1 hypothetical protein VF04_18300 [Nostoc linckia z7]PHK03590.1 hypothetical protein VF08_14830 [Nostoc linckia z8]PHK09800.1 hypothetical protein VF09_14220 [Nostoc linckia z9]PHK0986